MVCDAFLYLTGCSRASEDKRLLQISAAGNVWSSLIIDIEDFLGKHALFPVP